VAAGTFSIAAVATDDLNAKTTSSAITVLVNNNAGGGAIFYQNSNFVGINITLEPGDYTATQMSAKG